MPIDPYSPQWESETYNQLAPQVEALVNRVYGAQRGARFGGAGAMLAKRLAALRTEISLQAANQKAAIQEKQRQEGVAEAAKVSENQRRVGEQQREETVAANNAALKKSQDWQDYQTRLGDYKKQQSINTRLALESKTGDFTPETLRDAGYSDEQIANWQDSQKKKRGFNTLDDASTFDPTKEIGDRLASAGNLRAPWYTGAGSGASGFPNPISNNSADVVSSNSTDYGSGGGGGSGYGGSGKIDVNNLAGQVNKGKNDANNIFTGIKNGINDVGDTISNTWHSLWAPSYNPGTTNPDNSGQDSNIEQDQQGMVPGVANPNPMALNPNDPNDPRNQARATRGFRMAA